jgi:hypothetical protein
MPRHSQRFWLAAFVVAWAVDFLFWGKSVGISYLIFILLVLFGGYLLAWDEHTRLNKASLALSGLVIALASVTVLRSEVFTRLMSGFVAFCALGLLAMTFRSGRWVRFRMLDYVTTSVELFIVTLVRGASLRLFPAAEAGTSRGAALRKAAPLLRGLLLALPVVFLLAALLASADLVFADQLSGLLKIFNFARLPEYLFRLFYILALAYAFAGLYLQAVLPTRWGMRPQPASAVTVANAAQPAKAETEASPAEGNPLNLSPDLPGYKSASESVLGLHLGSTEAFVVLGSVDLLFTFFVAIQFRYFFGGQANVTAAGYTFSEYARRGFFELVWVAVISLLLYLALNALTRREKPLQERFFTGLAVLLVGLVWIILASAFQRLLLYEDAYGFTSLRIYTHIFIPWLGFLLLATIVLQIIRREQFFGGLLLLTAFGFVLTFGVINIDGLIVRQNVARAQAGAELDGQYLNGLSDDAIPALVAAYQATGQAADIRDQLGAVLSCRAYNLEYTGPNPAPQQKHWQSFHFGREVGRRALDSLDLSTYPIHEGSYGPQVLFGGGEINCFPKLPVD